MAVSPAKEKANAAGGKKQKDINLKRILPDIMRMEMSFLKEAIKKENGNIYPAWSGTWDTPEFEVTTAVFDASFKNYLPQSTENWFLNLTHLKKIVGLTNLNTSEVTTMRGMFAGCFSLTSLDLSNFNTENVQNMSSMFYGCSSLTSLDLSNFDTSNVTNMNSMFYLDGYMSGDKLYIRDLKHNLHIFQRE